MTPSHAVGENTKPPANCTIEETRWPIRRSACVSHAAIGSSDQAMPRMPLRAPFLRQAMTLRTSPASVMSMKTGPAHELVAKLSQLFTAASPRGRTHQLHGLGANKSILAHQMCSRHIASPAFAASSASVTPASESSTTRPGCSGTGTTLGTATVR